jgi:hypothetical protein
MVLPAKEYWKKHATVFVLAYMRVIPTYALSASPIFCLLYLCNRFHHAMTLKEIFGLLWKSLE